MRFISLKSQFVLLALLMVSACAIKPRVTSDYDTAFNFNQLTTYAWIEAKSDDKKVITLESKRQLNAIETILNRKGFNKVSATEKPTFLLKTHTVTDKKVDVDRFYSTWGYRPFFYDSFHPHFYGWPHSSTTVVTERKIGTLVLDIVDPVKEQVIWRGTVSSTLDIYKNKSPEERTTAALANAQAMLSSFPPGAVIQE
ncbi:DUF4136 domain-containing protein [Aliikangiella sp. IMCC44359]|uniref:DUF4136 domain-containing protein n=1 Tax=Aliikangiella sp. IMCC44359 TaxID=3459125 RepID=UPI00403B37F6